MFCSRKAKFIKVYFASTYMCEGSNSLCAKTLKRGKQQQEETAFVKFSVQTCLFFPSFQERQHGKNSQKSFEGPSIEKRETERILRKCKETYSAFK